MALSYDEFFLQHCIRDVWETDSTIGLQNYSEAYSDDVSMSINGEVRTKQNHADAARQILAEWKVSFTDAELILKKPSSDDGRAGTVAFRLAVQLEERATGVRKTGVDVVIATVAVVGGRQRCVQYFEVTV